MRQMEDVLKSSIVLIGFTIASDLYDLIPPRKGGFVFGGKRGRIYFDLDENGNLIELRDLIGKDMISSQLPSGNISLPQKVKAFLEIHSAFYRRFKRSALAMWLCMNIRHGEKSVWAGPDTALAISLDNEYMYRWQLAGELLKKIAAEADEKGITVVLVNIPYLPQAYDNIWASSYGRFPKRYDRWIAGKRLEEICARAGIYYVDVTPRFVDESRRRKKRFHYPLDAHPTAEGHRIIAETVAEFLKEGGLIKESRMLDRGFM
jgi:hypothetical protein